MALKHVMIMDSSDIRECIQKEISILETLASPAATPIAPTRSPCGVARISGPSRPPPAI